VCQRHGPAQIRRPVNAHQHEALPGVGEFTNTPSLMAASPDARWLDLAFHLNRAGNQDIYMAERADVDQGL
jgi:hypothetical protein